MQLKLIKNFKFQIKNYISGFTLIELIIVIAITAVLSAVVLFSVKQYVNKGKDSNISASLAVLIPSAERYYDSNGVNGYLDFCNPTLSGGAIFKNIILQMPDQSFGAPCYTDATTYSAATNPKGACCFVKDTKDAWVACARKFTDTTKAFCVDSRGVKKDICTSQCTIASPITSCPDILPSCP